MMMDTLMTRETFFQVGVGVIGAGILYALWSLWTMEKKSRKEDEEQKKRKEEREKQKMEAQTPKTLTFALSPGYGASMEAFSPEPLLGGEHFKIQLTGTYEYKSKSPVVYGKADAYYYAAEEGLFDQSYEGVYFGQSSDRDRVAVTPFRKDRHLHCYAYSWVGKGTKLSVLVKYPLDSSTACSSTMRVTISPLTPLEQSLATQEYRAEQERYRREEKQRERDREEQTTQERAQRAAEEQRRCEEAERQKQEMGARFRRLSLGYATFPYYVDRQFLTHYAAQHRAVLLKEQARIRRSLHEFFEDSRFITYLRTVAPREAVTLMMWATWEARALAIAERLDVAPPPTPPPPPVRPKLTFDQRRDKMLAWKQAKARDRMEATKLQLELEAEFAAELAQHNLDKEECQKLLGLFREGFFSEEENGDGSFKKL